MEFCRYNAAIYPTTVALMPYFVELAATAPHHRARILYAVGLFADDISIDGDVEETRPALRAGVASLVPFLADPDPEIRTAAAYALRQAGDACPASALWERWAVEDIEEVRISLLFTLAAADPDRAANVFTLAGAAGAPYGDRLAAVAAGLPSVEWRRRITAEFAAARALALLGDPRWLAPVLETWQTGRGARMVSFDEGFAFAPALPLTDAVVEEIRRQLARATSGGNPFRERFLADLVTRAGDPRAAETAPELRAATDLAPAAIRSALVVIGAATDLEMREAAADGDAVAAASWCRRTGDAGSFITLILTRENLATTLTAALPVADLLAEAAPELRAILAGDGWERVRALAGRS